MQPTRLNSTANLVIDGVVYFSAAYVARAVGVTRQTLWRWRQDGKVPLGRRYRDKQVLFTERETDLIREYAHRLEPIAGGDIDLSNRERLIGAKEASNGEQ
jgi:hypothetical protein